MNTNRGSTIQRTKESHTFHLPVFFFKWAEHSARTNTLLIATGVSIEIGVVIFGTLLKQFFHDATPISIEPETYRTYILLNSVMGCIGSLIICYGILSAIKRYEVSKPALRWAYTAGLFIIAYKGFDILQTIRWMFFANLLGTAYDIDIFVSNILLLGSVLTILIGLLRALHDANRFAKALSSRNLDLDREIRERHRSELQARSSEARFSVILNALHSALVLADKEGNILAHNDVFTQLFKDDDSGPVLGSLLELIPEDILAEGRDHARKVFESGLPVDFIFTRNKHHWETHIFPVRGEEDKVDGITVIATDITDRVRTEEERRLLETAINNAAECIMITDMEGRIEYVNPAFEEQTGYKRQEVMGHTPALIKSGIHPNEYYKELWETIKQGKIWRGSFINRARDGHIFREIATISPIIVENGVISHFVAVKRDCTREHQLERQLWQAQKMEALGMLAGGIAHDLRNVLSIILGETELVQEMLGEGHPCHQNLETVIQTVLSSTSLIRHLLTFARQGEGEDGPLYIAPLIKENMRALRSFLPSNIQVVENNSLKKEIIKGLPCDIQQILVNLLNNANQAMQPAGGVIELTLDTITLQEKRSVSTGILEAGGYVRLCVRDTGCGMDKEVLPHIFEPFFSTKESGTGTGLGLSMVHGSILRMGGQIHVESEPGKGTVFHIYLPQVFSEPDFEPAAFERVSGEGISVIVVDDMADFNDLLAINLKSHDYQVTTFSDAFEALEYFRADGGRADIVVVDYMMPFINGKDFTRQLHEMRPDLPVVLLTGYTSEITKENAREHGFCAIFTKPIEVDRLSNALFTLARR